MSHSKTRLYSSLHSDSTACDIGTSDDQTLLPEAEYESEKIKAIKQFVSDVLKNNFKVFIVVCDVFCILTFTSAILAITAFTCEDSAVDETLEWCTPYEPVTKVQVDLSFDLLVHCDSPRSCVAWAELQGGRYNFILGDEELVYVGRGYQCGGDGVLRLQMLITRYTWDPVQPVYRVPEEVVLRYGEVVQEGLRCGKISPHFTVEATCSVYGAWCGAPNIRDHIPWTTPAALALAREPRHPWYDPPHPQNHPFFAFDVSRVYDRHHSLKTCNRTVMGL